MITTQISERLLFSFLEKKYSCLLVLDTSEVKRSFFLGELIDAMEQQPREGLYYFRFTAGEPLETLVQAITEQFMIPARSVNVNAFNQLKGQLDTLRQMGQQIIFFIEQAHLLPQTHLLALLEIASCQAQPSSVLVVFLGKPKLEKHVRQSGFYSDQDGWGLLHLSSVDESAIDSMPGIQKAFWQKFPSSAIRDHLKPFAWRVKRKIRWLSILLLSFFIIFLWKKDEIARFVLQRTTKPIIIQENRSQIGHSDRLNSKKYWLKMSESFDSKKRLSSLLKLKPLDSKHPLSTTFEKLRPADQNNPNLLLQDLWLHIKTMNRKIDHQLQKDYNLNEISGVALPAPIIK